MNSITVYEKDNGSEIFLPLHTILRVALEENPSTGYQWQVEKSSSSCLTMVSSKYFAKNYPVIGSAGIRVFFFQPTRPGRCMLSIKLWRAWEGNKSIVKRFQLAVSING